MNRTLLICLPLIGLNVLTGCLFANKSAKPKENPAIAADLDAIIKQRWVEKRSAELAAQGLAPEAARGQAAEEFRVRYRYLGAAQK